MAKRKKKVKPSSVDSQIHVRIENHIQKRKNILESAIFSTELLQKYENFKKLRNQKNKQMALLKKTVKEISLLFKELKFKELPQIKIEKEGPIAPKIFKEKEIPQPRKDELSRELESIKSKLENLNI